MFERTDCSDTESRGGGSRRRKAPRGALFAFALVALTVVGPALPVQSADISYELPELAELPEVPIEDGAIVLDLKAAIEIALERNLALIVERQNRAVASYRVFEALGIYDMNGTVSLSAFDEEAPTASNLDGADVSTQESVAVNLGLSRLLSSGGGFSIDWNNRRFESNSTFATLNPSFTADFDLGFRQPLLRNRGRDVTEQFLTIARTNLDISREVFEQQIIAVISAVENSYMDVIDAREQLQVARESLALAEELHEQNRIRVDVGTLAPLELVQSEAGVATRKEEIIRAEAALGDAEDVLKQLLNLDHPDLWEAPLNLTTEIQVEAIEVDLDEAIATALDRRPAIRSKKLSNEIAALNLSVARNQQLPQLDFSVRYGFNGVGGDVTERDFFTGEILSQAPGSYDDALQQVLDTEFAGWAVGLDLAYPIGNRAAKARRAIAEVEVDQSEMELRDLELAIRTEVRRTYRFLSAARQAVESAEVSQELAEKTLDAEQKRYDNGLSTSFQLLEIQEDLTAARSRLVASKTAYRKSMIAFYTAIGRLLEISGVRLAEEEPAVSG